MAEKPPLTLPYFPISYEVEAGKTYRWCGCGDTSTSPLCNKNDCTKAVTFKPFISETVILCGCQQTQDPPYCDGSHAKVLLDLIKKYKEKE